MTVCKKNARNVEIDETCTAPRKSRFMLNQNVYLRTPSIHCKCFDKAVVRRSICIHRKRIAALWRLCEASVWLHINKVLIICHICHLQAGMLQAFMPITYQLSAPLPVEVQVTDVTCANHTKLMQKNSSIQTPLSLQPDMTHLCATESLPHREKLHHDIQPS